MSGAGAGAGAEEEKKQEFFYTMDSFGPLPMMPLHMDITLVYLEEDVRVHATTTFENRTKEPVSTLALNFNFETSEVVSITRLMGASTLGSSNAGNSKAFLDHIASFETAVEHPADATHTEDKEKRFVHVHLTEPVAPGAELVLRSVSITHPNDSVLEGVYRDFTLDGFPRTRITQCQQVGFQRIVPSVDRMLAKMAFTVTLIADKRYTSLLSNGDPAEGYADATGAPKPVPASEADVSAAIAPPHELDRRVVMRYNNHTIPMAPYLFFAGVGTYETYRRTLEYATGESFLLELLVFPEQVEPQNATEAINAMHDSIQFVHLDCGPEAADHKEERAEIHALLKEREAIKERLSGPLVTAFGPFVPEPEPHARPDTAEADEARLVAVRARLKELVMSWGRTGYSYTAKGPGGADGKDVESKTDEDGPKAVKVYREIAMMNSAVGGMENTGNTTILSSMMTPSQWLADPGYLYMEGVKVHEFYHNINGSNVSGASPFTIWLNEAVTVHIQRQREYQLFGADFMRLRTVLYAFRPATGPLDQDKGPLAMAIQPKGFNSTWELISAMTYSKAPEVVKMIERLISFDTFNKALDLYHRKFHLSNATTDDWVAAMEEASGMSLKPMADGWLNRSNHPVVEYTTEYDAAAKTYTVHVNQSNVTEGMTPWEFPAEWALFTDGGATKSHSGMFHVKDAKQSFTIADVSAAPAFFSFARDWSYFGTYSGDATDDELRLQAANDDDVINRYFAHRRLADREKAAVVEALLAGNKDHVVSDSYVELVAKTLFDSSMSASTRALILAETDALPDRADLSHHYWELSHACTALHQAVWDKHGAAIVAAFNDLAAATRPGPFLEQLHDRALKAHLFGYIKAGAVSPSVLTSRTGGSGDVEVAPTDLATDMLGSPFMSEKTYGFRQALNIGGDGVEDLKENARMEWSIHPIGVEAYVTAIGSTDSDATVGLIRTLVDEDDLFDINLAGHARSLCRAWGANRKRCLLSDDGLELTKYLLVKVGVVNEMSAGALVSAFSDLAKFDDATKTKLLDTLAAAREDFDAEKHKSIHGRLTQLLKAHGRE